MKLFIKNMVCDRCRMVVKSELEKHGLHTTQVTLGEVEIVEQKIPAAELKRLGHALQQLGFELIDDKKSRIIEQIKTTAIKLVHYTDDKPREKQSELIARELNHDYSSLSKLFSEVEGITIEQYIINQKIEKVKEYIVYDELSLSEIADRIGYSSVAHLSAQFKKITGLTPSHFKTIGPHHRKPLDTIGKKQGPPKAE